MRACVRSRGCSFDTRYHEGLKNDSAMIFSLRQPRPQLEAYPVEEVVHQYPDKSALPHLYLADAFHAGTQPLGHLLNSRLNQKVTAAFKRGGHGRYFCYADRKREVGKRIEDERALLADLEQRDVSLINLHSDAIVFQRRHFEQHLAPFYRGAEQLTEIAAHDDAREGSRDLRPGELFVQKGQLRRGLVHLLTHDPHRCPVTRGHRLPVLALVLVTLALPFYPLEPQVAVVHAAHHLALGNDIAGPHRGLDDVPVKGGDHRPLHLPFDRRFCRDPVLDTNDAEEDHGQERRSGDQF